VTKGIENPSKPEDGLMHVARVVNLFASAGVPPKSLHFVVVLQGPATMAILDNAAYKAKYGVDNPNIPLINVLRKTGVYVNVCGQALADYGIAHANVYKEVRIDLSALVTSIVYGDMGYAYIKL
ncbi:MAG: DsrE family protein, partial [Gammaproteobacteria bacterium]